MSGDIPILIEKSGSKSNSLHDDLQVLDTLAILLESHGTAVVDVNDHIVQRQTHYVNGDLARNLPSLAESVDLLGGALGSLLDARVARRVEGL